MTKTKSTVMMDRSNRIKQYIAFLIDQNIGSAGDEILYECWMDIAIMLGKFTPGAIKPDMTDKNNVRLWNLLTENYEERKFIGTTSNES